MSIDRYYTQIDGKWTRISAETTSSDFWVDICHGRNFSVDERYYFADLASALDFYAGGWKERQYLDDDGKDVGLDHMGLYSRGRLVHGLTIHGDAPGHEGENLRQICEELVKKMDQEQSGENNEKTGRNP
jgi:hypothetical protein